MTVFRPAAPRAATVAVLSCLPWLAFAKNRLTTMLARIRWMARVELGGECPIGTVDQEIAKEFLQVWDMAEAARAKPASQWTPMTKSEGRAVSAAIGKVREAAARGEG